jgi:hypothetical protein
MAAIYPIRPLAAQVPASRALFDEMTTYLGSLKSLALSESAVEGYAIEEGREVIRRLLEEHLAWRASHERRVRVVDQEGTARPVARRTVGKLRTLVGVVKVPTWPIRPPSSRAGRR